MRTAADELLEGAIDLHAHIFPQARLEEPGRVLDHEWARLARDAGMRGFAMKSHLWPTMAQARILSETFPGLAAIGTITLNNNVGGFCPFSAESAVKLGAKIIWMPTFSAANDIQVGAYSKRIAAWYQHDPPGEALTVFGGGGKILPEVDAIMEIARDAGAVIATGHLSAEEGVALARRAKVLGLEKFIFTHALNRAVKASDAQMREVAELGYFVEHCFLSTFPMWQNLAPQKIAEAIRLIGPGRSIMTTDGQMDFNPPPPEMLRMFIATMLQLGMDKEDIEWMVKRNPAKLAGLES
ncbi:MAG: DUF6282 family protein [bacterium]